MKVKLTNPTTCRIIWELTKDPKIYGKCPIIMEKSTWLAIKPSVMMKKREGLHSDVMNDLFSKFFKLSKQ